MGSSRDAYNTMRLVHQIYFADENWRTQFHIPAPGPYLA
jgi:hypothetical protein